MKKAFENFYLDELRQILGGDEDDENLKDLTKAVDKNGDSMINFEEFKDMIITLHKQNSIFCTSEHMLNVNKASILFQDRRVSMYWS